MAYIRAPDSGCRSSASRASLRPAIASGRTALQTRTERIERDGRVALPEAPAVARRRRVPALPPRPPPPSVPRLRLHTALRLLLRVLPVVLVLRRQRARPRAQPHRAGAPGRALALCRRARSRPAADHVRAMGLGVVPEAAAARCRVVELEYDDAVALARSRSVSIAAVAAAPEPKTTRWGVSYQGRSRRCGTGMKPRPAGDRRDSVRWNRSRNSRCSPGQSVVHFLDLGGVGWSIDRARSRLR